MPHLETVSLGLWVGAGARHETDREHGISHFLEHMAFKGTRRRSAQQIAEEIEEVGGELNAATSLETTAYFARVLKGDEGVALDLLADILQNSAFGRPELERERQVILQEIAATRDSPDDIVYDLLHDAAFPQQPVGRPILGTPASVGSFTAADLKRFLGRRYGPGNMVISAAGAVHHANVVRHAEALFGGLTDERRTTGERPAKYVGGVRVSEKPFEQSHLLLGFPQSLLPGRCVLHGPGVLGAVRRGHVVPTVPGGAREARPLLRDLLDRVGLAGRGTVRHSRGDGNGIDGRAHRRHRRGAEACGRAGSRRRRSWRAPRRSSRPAC